MIKLDVLIDDCVDNLINADYYGILFNYPWNESYKEDIFNNNGEAIERVDRWSEMPNVISCLRVVGVPYLKVPQRN